MEEGAEPCAAVVPAALVDDAVVAALTVTEVFADVATGARTWEDATCEDAGTGAAEEDENGTGAGAADDLAPAAPVDVTWLDGRHCEYHSLWACNTLSTGVPGVNREHDARRRRCPWRRWWVRLGRGVISCPDRRISGTHQSCCRRLR
jgi:hypothetical protein